MGLSFVGFDSLDPPKPQVRSPEQGVSSPRGCGAGQRRPA